MTSDRARRLNEALHDVFSNEQRWEIIDRFLLEERKEAQQDLAGAEEHVAPTERSVASGGST